MRLLASEWPHTVNSAGMARISRGTSDVLGLRGRFSLDKAIIKAALSEAIAKREQEKQQLIAELEKIEREEVEQQVWLERQMRESSGR